MRGVVLSPPSVRVRAADSVLDHAKQAIEIEDAEVRVAALEQAAESATQSRWWFERWTRACEPNR
jgi:hypothetical protein